MTQQPPSKLDASPAEAGADVTSTSEPMGRRHQEAFEATKAARAALPAESVPKPFADVYTSASLVGAAATRSAAYRAQLAELPLPKDLLEQVERLALAATYAQTRYLHTLQPPEEVAGLIEDLKEHRETLYGDVQGLVRRKIVPAGQLEGINTLPGYRPVVVDVLRLVEILRGVWQQIEGKTMLTSAELDRIAALNERAERVVEMREDTDKSRPEANLDRQRAFALMVDGYGQLRRGLNFILWDSELLDQVAPPIRVGGRRRRPGKDDEDEELASPVAGATGAPATNGASNGGGASSGQPSDSPFVDG